MAHFEDLRRSAESSEKIVNRAERVSQAEELGDDFKTEILPLRINALSKSILDAKSFLTEDFVAEKARTDKEFLKKFSNPWHAFNMDGFVARNREEIPASFIGFAEGLEDLMELHEGNKGLMASNKLLILAKYLRQIWRTEITAHLAKMLPKDNDGAEAMEQILASQIVGEREKSPADALRVASSVLPELRDSELRAKLASGMEATEGVTDLAEFAEDGGMKISVLIGGEMLEIPQGLAASFQFKHFAVNETGTRFYMQMANGCKGNLVVIELTRLPDLEPPRLDDEPLEIEHDKPIKWDVLNELKWPEDPALDENPLEVTSLSLSERADVLYTCAFQVGDSVDIYSHNVENYAELVNSATEDSDREKLEVLKSDLIGLNQLLVGYDEMADRYLDGYKKIIAAKRADFLRRDQLVPTDLNVITEKLSDVEELLTGTQEKLTTTKEDFGTYIPELTDGFTQAILNADAGGIDSIPDVDLYVEDEAAIEDSAPSEVLAENPELQEALGALKALTPEKFCCKRDPIEDIIEVSIGGHEAANTLWAAANTARNVDLANTANSLLKFDGFVRTEGVDRTNYFASEVTRIGEQIWDDADSVEIAELEQFIAAMEASIYKNVFDKMDETAGGENIHLEDFQALLSTDTYLFLENFMLGEGIIWERRKQALSDAKILLDSLRDVQGQSALAEGGSNSPEDTDTAEPKHMRLREKMGQLRGKMYQLSEVNDWEGVEAVFIELEALAGKRRNKVSLDYQDYWLGAQSARAAGDLNEVYRRLYAAKNLDPTAEVTEWLTDLNQRYGKVEFGTRDGLWYKSLEPANMPSAPDQKAAIEAAQSFVEDHGRYQGLLPFGEYTLTSRAAFGDRESKLVVTAAGLELEEEDDFDFEFEAVTETDMDPTPKEEDDGGGVVNEMLAAEQVGHLDNLTGAGEGEMEELEFATENPELTAALAAMKAIPAEQLWYNHEGSGNIAKSLEFKDRYLAIYTAAVNSQNTEMMQKADKLATFHAAVGEYIIALNRYEEMWGNGEWDASNLEDLEKIERLVRSTIGNLNRAMNEFDKNGDISSLEINEAYSDMLSPSALIFLNELLNGESDNILYVKQEDLRLEILDHISDMNGTTVDPEGATVAPEAEPAVAEVAGATAELPDTYEKFVARFEEISAEVKKHHDAEDWEACDAAYLELEALNGFQLGEEEGAKRFWFEEYLYESHEHKRKNLEVFYYGSKAAEMRGDITEAYRRTRWDGNGFRKEKYSRQPYQKIGNPVLGRVNAARQNLRTREGRERYLERVDELNSRYNFTAITVNGLGEIEFKASQSNEAGSTTPVDPAVAEKLIERAKQDFKNMPRNEESGYGNYGAYLPAGPGFTYTASLSRDGGQVAAQTFEVKSSKENDGNQTSIYLMGEVSEEEAGLVEDESLAETTEALQAQLQAEIAAVKAVPYETIWMSKDDRGITKLPEDSVFFDHIVAIGDAAKALGNDDVREMARLIRRFHDTVVPHIGRMEEIGAEIDALSTIFEGGDDVSLKELGNLRKDFFREKQWMEEHIAEFQGQQVLHEDNDVVTCEALTSYPLSMILDGNSAGLMIQTTSAGSGLVFDTHKEVENSIDALERKIKYREHVESSEQSTETLNASIPEEMHGINTSLDGALPEGFYFMPTSGNDKLERRVAENLKQVYEVDFVQEWFADITQEMGDDSIYIISSWDSEPSNESEAARMNALNNFNSDFNIQTDAAAWNDGDISDLLTEEVKGVVDHGEAIPGVLYSSSLLNADIPNLKLIYITSNEVHENLSELQLPRAEIAGESVSVINYPAFQVATCNIDFCLDRRGHDWLGSLPNAKQMSSQECLDTIRVKFAEMGSEGWRELIDGINEEQDHIILAYEDMSKGMNVWHIDQSTQEQMFELLKRKISDVLDVKIDEIPIEFYAEQDAETGVMLFKARMVEQAGEADERVMSQHRVQLEDAFEREDWEAARDAFKNMHEYAGRDDTHNDVMPKPSDYYHGVMAAFKAKDFENVQTWAPEGITFYIYHDSSEVEHYVQAMRDAMEGSEALQAASEMEEMGEQVLDVLGGQPEVFGGDTALDTGADETVAEAEHTRLYDEMRRLSKRNAWKGVEAAFIELEALSIKRPEEVQLNYNDLWLGAQSGRAMGKTTATYERLLKAKELDASREVIEWLSDWDDTYGRVDLHVIKEKRSDEDLILIPAAMPFAPDERAAIETAQAKLMEEGEFEGLLPKGEYSFGKKTFTVLGMSNEHHEIIRLDVSSEAPEAEVGFQATAKDKRRARVHLEHVESSISQMDINRRQFYAPRGPLNTYVIPGLDQCDENGWKYKYTSSNGDTWYVAEGPWMTDQYPNGLPEHRAQLTIWKKGAEDLIHDAFRFTVGNVNNIEHYIQQAEENYRQQEFRQDLMHDIDFKEAKRAGTPIGYISLFQYRSSEDVVIRGIKDDSENLPALMRERGYNFIDSAPVETARPEEYLLQQIQVLKEQNVRNVYLDLNSHGQSVGNPAGQSEGMHFNGDNDLGILDGAELVEIIRQNPDMNFIINSIACHGGDYRKHFEAANLPNADLILQSKPYNTAEEGRLANGTADSTYFNLFYHRALGKLGEDGPFAELPGKDKMKDGIQSIGDAARYADLMMGKYIHANAEAVRAGGTLITEAELEEDSGSELA
jgi:hypothetical protein